jgi:hypothetical protein
MENLDNYIGTKTAIHCPTFEQAEAINDKLMEIGYTALDRLSSIWDKYKEEFCIDVESTVSAASTEISFYELEHYTIIEAEQFLVPTIKQSYSIF